MKMKKCSKCKKTKVKSKFSKRTTSKDGLYGQCKACKSICDRKYRGTKRGKQVARKAQRKHRQSIRGCVRHRFDSINNHISYRTGKVKCLITFEEFFHYITVTLGFNTRDKLTGLVIGRKNLNKHFELSNLDVVTHSQQQMHLKKVKTCCGKPPTSKYKGVSWYKRYKKWMAQIKVQGKSHYLGIFENEVDAAVAYDEASLKHHGEFGLTNVTLGLYD